MSIKKILLCMMGFILLSCERKEQTHEKDQIRVIKMPEIVNEIFLPTEMWDQVTGASFEKSVKQDSGFNFAPIKVILQDKSEGVLSDSAIRFEYPNGGGEIDLSKYVVNSKGTFRVQFQFDGLPSGDDLKIYYISKGKKRKIDGEIYGSGCKYFYDLKNYITKINPLEGIEVNVTRDRHISTLAGHFVFAYKKDKQTFLSQVTFTDSKRKDLLCDDVKKNPSAKEI